MFLFHPRMLFLVLQVLSLASGAAEENASQLRSAHERARERNPSAELCHLCMRPFSPDSHKPLTTICGHVFHVSCLSTWRERGRNSCPFCLAELAECPMAQYRRLAALQFRERKASEVKKRRVMQLIAAELQKPKRQATLALGRFLEQP